MQYDAFLAEEAVAIPIALLAEEAVADCEYEMRDGVMSTFRANAISSQNALRNKPFRELNISISNTERRTIDHDYEEEVRQAMNDLNSGRVKKKLTNVVCILLMSYERTRSPMYVLTNVTIGVAMKIGFIG